MFTLAIKWWRENKNAVLLYVYHDYSFVQMAISFFSRGTRNKRDERRLFTEAPEGIPIQKWRGRSSDILRNSETKPISMLLGDRHILWEFEAYIFRY